MVEGSIVQVTSVQAALNVTSKLMLYPRIGVDCRGRAPRLRLGLISVVIIVDPKHNVYLFDLLTCPSIMLDGNLKSVLESEKLLKVFHSVGEDVMFLFSKYGVQLRNVYDVQLAFEALELANPKKFLPGVLLPNQPDPTSLLDIFELYGIRYASRKVRMIHLTKGKVNSNNEPLGPERRHRYNVGKTKLLLVLLDVLQGKEILLKKNILVENLIYETLMVPIVPHFVEKRRQVRRAALKIWREENNDKPDKAPFTEPVHSDNDYNIAPETLTTSSLKK